MYYLFIILQQSEIVENVDILHSAEDEGLRLFHGKATLIDGSFLFVREMLIQKRERYSYHWQGKAGELICRWDNAPHYPNVKNFPHHKHKGAESNVVASEVMVLERVLKIIEQKMKKNNKN